MMAPTWEDYFKWSNLVTAYQLVMESDDAAKLEIGSNSYIVISFIFLQERMAILFNWPWFWIWGSL